MKKTLAGRERFMALGRSDVSRNIMPPLRNNWPMWAVMAYGVGRMHQIMQRSRT